MSTMQRIDTRRLNSIPFSYMMPGLCIEMERRRHINRNFGKYLKLIPPYITVLYSVLTRGAKRPEVKEFRVPEIPRKDKKKWIQGRISCGSYAVDKVRTFRVQKPADKWIYKYYVDFVGFAQ